MATNIETIRQILKNKRKLAVPGDWLEACVEWVREENEGRKMSTSEYEQAIWDQWLVCDLRELSHSCLPPNLAEQSKMDLNSVYSLQWEPKAGRMIMLKMTDGVQDVQGMEYQPIRCLNTSLIPGTKVQIRGPVMCRRGVMMLKENKITVLGGEVESLAETNTLDLMLEKSLKSNTEMNDVRWQQRKKQFSPKKTQNSHRATGSLSARYKTQVSQHNNQLSNVQQLFPSDFEDSMDIPDDDLLDNIDLEDHWDQDDMDIEEMMDDAMTSVEQQSLLCSAPAPTHREKYTHKDEHPQQHRRQSQTVRRETNAQTSHVNFLGMSNNNFENVTININVNAETDLSNNKTFTSQLNKSGVDRDEKNIAQQKLDAFMTKPISSMKEVKVKPMSQKSSYTGNGCGGVGLYSEPFTYLSLINRLHTGDHPITVKVKAYVATMLSKLEHNGGSQWSLTVKINDGTAAVDVDISDQVLTQLIGFSAAECQNLRERARSDAKVKQKLKQGILKCQQTLTDLSCIMELEVKGNSTNHTLRQLYSLKADDPMTLQDRYK